MNAKKQPLIEGREPTYIPFPIKPNPVPIPEDGIYWIKEAERYRDWQLSEWRLVRLGGSTDIGWFEVFGDDQQGLWDGEYSCVAVLGPKVEAPE